MLISSCSSNGDEVLVSAASSLADAFIDMEAQFEHENPGVDVVLNLGGSSALREQILAGAPADVFAAANESTMGDVVAAGETAASPTVFALNAMTIIVPAGNAAGVAELADFAREDLLIGLCAPAVPCGEFARAVLAAADVSPAVDTNEPDVRALVTKIGLGELDAGIAYRTDVDEAVESVAVPAGVNITAPYPIAPLANAPSPDLGARFVEFVLSGKGRDILVSHGFDLP